MTIKESINENIKVIDCDLVFSEYHAEYHRNNNQNKISYIVTHDNGDEQYIDCLLLGINIFDYYSDIFGEEGFSMSYLKEFGLFQYNGFLGVCYYGENDDQNIKEFFGKYGNYFIKDYKPYSSHVIIELEDRVIQLHDEITKQIKIRDNLDELFWDR